MALIPCPECGKQVSTRAVACPHCGCPTEKVRCKECGIHITSGTPDCPECGCPQECEGTSSPIVLSETSPTNNLTRSPDCDSPMEEFKVASRSETPKRILPAFLLFIFFGPFGFHRFYCGKIMSGLLMPIVGVAGAVLLGLGGAARNVDFWVGSLVLWAILGIWGFIDFIRIIVGAMTDAEGRKIQKWT